MYISQHTRTCISRSTIEHAHLPHDTERQYSHYHLNSTKSMHNKITNASIHGIKGVLSPLS